MRLFFALIGALFGCFFVKGGSPAFYLVLSLAFLFAFSLAWISKRRRLFLLFFAFGIFISLLYSLLPVSSGPFRGAVIKPERTISSFPESLPVITSIPLPILIKWGIS